RRADTSPVEGAVIFPQNFACPRIQGGNYMGLTVENQRARSSIGLVNARCRICDNSAFSRGLPGGLTRSGVHGDDRAGTISRIGCRTLDKFLIVLKVG